MFEQEEQTIVQRVIGSTLGGRDTVSMNEVLAAEIPKGIKSFLLTGLVNELKEELRRGPKLSLVSRTVPGIEQTERALLRALAVEYLFPGEEYRRELQNAVHILFNYLTRPQATLSRFLLDSQPSVPFETLLLRLEYFSDYAYLGRLIERIGRQRQWTTVTADDIAALLAKIDDQVTRKHTPRELAMITRPIFELLLFGATARESTVPVSAIVAFYDDKQLSTIKEYVEKICHIRSRTHIAMDELVGIIEDLHLVETTAGNAMAAFEAAAPPTGTPKGRPQELPARGEAPVADRGKNIPLTLTYSALTEYELREDLRDLNQMLSREQRRRFIERIFQNDEEYFEVFTTALNMILTWREAQQFLTELCKLRQLDPASVEMLEFYSAVRSRYEASPAP